MKNLIILFLSLFAINTSFAQDTKNFKIVNGRLIWQKVYECKDSINQIVANLKKGGIVKENEITNNVITGIIKELDADYKGAGFSRGFTPIYLISNRITCSIMIDFKEGKYRVTIKNMKLTNFLESPISKVGESEPIETYALKKKNTVFKDIFLKDAVTILNYTFNKIFEQTSKEEDDNW